MQALATSDYRGYGWADHVDEDDSYPLYVYILCTVWTHTQCFPVITARSL